MEYTLTTQGLAPKEILKIQSLLRLFEGGSRGRWVFVKNTQADVILYDADQAETKPSLPKSIIAVAYGSQAPAEKESLFLCKPMRVHDFNRLLKKMQRIIASHHAGTTVSPEDWQTYNPSRYCLGVLQAALEDKKARLLNIKGLPPVYIESKGRHYYSKVPLEELSLLMTAPRADIDEDVITEQGVASDRSKIQAEALIHRPLIVVCCFTVLARAVVSRSCCRCGTPTDTLA